VTRPGAGVAERDGLDAGLVAGLRQRLLSRLATLAGPVPPGRRSAVVAQLVRAVLDEHTAGLIEAGEPMLAPQVEAALARRLRDGLTGMGGLQPLLEDPEVETVNVNGCDRVFVRFADGRREQVAPVAGSDAELVELVRVVAASGGAVLTGGDRQMPAEERRFDLGHPQVSLQLPDGSRLFACMGVTGRPCLSIRRHRFLRLDLADLVDKGEITGGVEALFAAMVRARYNIVVSGAQAVGKTTFVRALASAIPAWERLVTIEDVYELGLDADGVHPDVVAMQTREANIEGAGAVEAVELGRWALRMAADRVIVGEVRDKVALVMLLAMSQGNDGSMCTVHASSSEQAFERLAVYSVQAPERLSFEAVHALIGGAVHFVVHLEVATDGTRVVSSVREVTGHEGARVISNEVYQPGPDRRAQPRTPIRASTMERLVAAGLDPVVLERDSWSRR